MSEWNIKIENHTDWDTKQLKKLTLEVCKKAGAKEWTYIYVYTGKGRGCCHGRATLNGNRIWMYVPPLESRKWKPIYHPIEKVVVNGKPEPKFLRFDKNNFEKNKFPVKDYAQVLEHEIGHNLGLRHKEMMRVGNIDVAYVEGFAVEPKKKRPKSKPNRDLIQERADNAKKQLKKWELKLKRSKTFYKKWADKVKYYEKKLEERKAKGTD